MLKPLTNWILRVLVIALAGVALLGAIVVGIGMINQKTAQSENRALRADLQADPIAIRLRDQSAQRCTATGREHYWICGVVLEAKPSLDYGYCSTPERPLYFGTLDQASQTDLLGDLTFSHAISISDVSVSPTNVDTPYAYPHVFPPEDITATEPELPTDFTRIQYQWVSHESLPILFATGSLNWKLASEERAALPVGLIFKHPELPLRVATSVPIAEIRDWRDVITAAQAKVSEAVISFDAGQSCSKPPESVRFLYNIHNTSTLSALRDWVKENHDQKSAAD